MGGTVWKTIKRNVLLKLSINARYRILGNKTKITIAEVLMSLLQDFSNVWECKKNAMERI